MNGKELYINVNVLDFLLIEGLLELEHRTDMPYDELKWLFGTKSRRLILAGILYSKTHNCTKINPSIATNSANSHQQESTASNQARAQT